MSKIVKRYMSLKAELEKLEKSIDFVYVFVADKTEHSQMVEAQQRNFLWGFGFALVSENETLANCAAFKFAAPEKMEPREVHNIRCRLLLIQRDIIANKFESLDAYK